MSSSTRLSRIIIVVRPTGRPEDRVPAHVGHLHPGQFAVGGIVRLAPVAGEIDEDVLVHEGHPELIRRHRPQNRLRIHISKRNNERPGGRSEDAQPRVQALGVFPRDLAVGRVQAVGDLADPQVSDGRHEDAQLRTGHVRSLVEPIEQVLEC